MATVGNNLVADCPKCGNSVEGELTPHLKHYAKGTCPECRYVWWLPKPDDDPTKYKRRKKSTNLAFGDVCQMCLRSREELPKNTTLEGHHVIEHQDGGKDDTSNIWTLCSACHQLVHWQRTYHG